MLRTGTGRAQAGAARHHLVQPQLAEPDGRRRRGIPGEPGGGGGLRARRLHGATFGTRAHMGSRTIWGLITSRTQRVQRMQTWQVLLMAVFALAFTSVGANVPVAGAQSDLDDFMQRVIERRDDNWKKLQQFILDEREVIELRGPDRNVMWGDRREFTWYMRDDRFVRSPVRFNGVAIGDADRRKYE